MDYLKKLISAIELHAVEEIRECFENGIHPNDLYNGQPLLFELTSEYTRTPRFKDCVRVFVDNGLEFQDQALLAVLLNDAGYLSSLLVNDPGIISRRYSLRAAYTPLLGVNLTHICAEFNHLDCLRVLVEHGADINAVAGLDEFGFGGQTPVFHTVNQNSNNSADVLAYLLLNKADLLLTVKGLIWGREYEWETFIPAVNPISYAMMGLIPQMHRNELIISKTISILMQAAFGIEYTPTNVPNKYLNR